jgi:hypothetical protein
MGAIWIAWVGIGHAMGGHKSTLMVKIWVWIQIRRKMSGFVSKRACVCDHYKQLRTRINFLEMHGEWACTYEINITQLKNPALTKFKTWKLVCVSGNSTTHTKWDNWCGKPWRVHLALLIVFQCILWLTRTRTRTCHIVHIFRWHTFRWHTLT